MNKKALVVILIQSLLYIYVAGRLTQQLPPGSSSMLQPATKPVLTLWLLLTAIASALNYLTSISSKVVLVVIFLQVSLLFRVLVSAIGVDLDR